MEKIQCPRCTQFVKVRNWRTARKTPGYDVCRHCRAVLWGPSLDDGQTFKVIAQREIEILQRRNPEEHRKIVEAVLATVPEPTRIERRESGHFWRAGLDSFQTPFAR